MKKTILLINILCIHLCTAAQIIGQKSPEIIVADTAGRTLKLSEINQGNYVLVEFWASWCRQCRVENPNIVSIYKKFKNKNFRIFSVSIDNNKAAWEKAIKDDGLIWLQGSDLKGWASSPIAAYAVQSIPNNFLIDPTGKIIATNLQRVNLQKTIQQLFSAK